MRQGSITAWLGCLHMGKEKYTEKNNDYFNKLYQTNIVKLFLENVMRKVLDQNVMAAISE